MRRIVPLIVALIGSVLVSCSGPSAPTWAASGVGVVATGCAGTTSEIGSGVTLLRPGQVVTTAHTVAGATSISVIDAGDHEYPATVAAFDKDADLAILDVIGLDAPPLPLGRAEVADAHAIVWSRDRGVHSTPLAVTRRLSITIEDIYVDEVTTRSGIELDGAITVGDSGGAVVNQRGEVIGIVYARSRQRDGIAFATDDEQLRRLLDERPQDPTDRCS